MSIKKIILTSAIALSILGTTVAHAAEATPISASTAVQQTSKSLPKQHSCHAHHQRHHAGNKILTSEQRQEMHKMIQTMFEQMRPLLRDKQALKLQLIGKLATPNTQWSDIAPLVNRINQNEAQITALYAKTQLASFQKFGVLLPPAYKHHGHKHAKNCHHHQYC